MSHPNPYAFQDDAVRSVVNDFTNNPSLKSLLVIPTGGGKTRTAVKSIFKLFDTGFFNEKKSKILWVAHRAELLEQARQAYELEGGSEVAKDALSRTIFQSNVPAGQTVLQDEGIKLVVIDEAHHAAASTYLPLFRPRVAVLGLTATPSRHDGKPLEFDGESYSIGFPDMEERGVVLKPEIIEKSGARSEIAAFDESSMEKLNTEERNRIIKNALLEDPQSYKKVIIYVGSKKHAKDLCQYLADSSLAEHYQSISYVLGGDGNNSRSQSREAFFQLEKGYERSIVVNVQVMTEGYDDPSVNTVVMAAPLRSKLTYMQCMGRAIRRNPTDPDKKAFLIEIADELPNIKYRIDNRWIYSEISDILEPRVIDREYTNAETLHNCLLELYEEFAVGEEDRLFPAWDPSERYQLLFFKKYKSGGDISHIPLILTKENRRQVQNWFNFLSVRFSLNKFNKINREQVMRSVQKWWGDFLSVSDTRLVVHAAMESCLAEEDFIKKHAPWVTFACLRKIVQDELFGLDEFLSDCLNADEIRSAFPAKSSSTYSVVKFPLPLGGCMAKFASSNELDAVQKLIEKIQALDKSSTRQFEEIAEVLANEHFPFESKYLSALPAIVTGNIPFSLKLN